MAPPAEYKNSLWWYLLHAPDQYVLFLHAPAWLAGSVMTVFSATAAAFGFVLLKLAYERQAHGALARVLTPRSAESAFEDKKSVMRYSTASMTERERTAQTSLPWCPPMLFWLGLLLYLVAGALYILALTFAPETTVAPLGVVQVMANVPLAYGVVHERFSRGDLIATAVCVMSMMVAVFAMPRNIPGHLRDFPMAEFIKFCDDMTNNYGFLCYVIVWTVLVLFCVNAHCVVQSQVRRPMLAFTMPTLTGLFSSAGSFLLKLVGTIYYHSDEDLEVWTHQSTHLITGFMVLFCLLSLFFVCQGLRHFDCRFFMPASFAVTTVLMIVQGFLFFREWDGMNIEQILCFAVACTLTVASVFFISWEHNSVRKPLSTAAGLDPGYALQPSAEETTVLTIMEEHGTRAIAPPQAWQLDSAYSSVNGAETDTENGASYDCSSGDSNSDSDSDDLSFSGDDNAPQYADVAASRRWLAGSCCGRFWSFLLRLHPLVMFVLLPAVPVLFFKLGYVWQAFTLLTLYSCLNCWKFGLHIALFSNVGRMKVKAYTSVDFGAMYAKLASYPESPEALAPIGFQEVMHFVILTNYKEDMQIMKEAILSVGISKIAKRQVSLVLAMEEREDGAAEKAKALIQEVGPMFRHAVYTLHPPGIPGEVPGKSANCRWAAQQLFSDHLPQLGYDLRRVVLTVMDADSEFHPEYFSALTYQFLTAPGDEARYNTIWQAPIIHYKNYHSQPALVRLASLLTSQHELANLADPSSVRMPYSTYSISGVLAQAVDGWDPDWISEDWHMCCKCFCATLGSLTIAPIFLPVMNYTPEAESWMQTLWARWSQAKRHALGVSELVYFAGSVPRILSDRRFRLRRRARLAISGCFLWIKMALVHGMMATSTLMGCLNGVMISYFYCNNLIANVNTFTFLANCIFSIFALSTFVVYLYTNVKLYDKVAYRIAGSDEPGVRAWWGSNSLHFLTILLGCTPAAPILFIMGGLCEWIAALKTAVTHKFDYEVALKPQAASVKTAST